MTPSEFKSWFDGFTEAMSGCPTKAQWSRIKERVAEIDGKATTERVYIDRYWHYPTLQPYWTYLSGHASVGCSTAVGSNAVQNVSNNVPLEHAGYAYDGQSAMYALGKADAQAIAN